MGLARNKPFYLAAEGEENIVQRGPSYMMALENSQLISENTFSFYLSPDGKDSHIDFGQPDEASMKSSRSLQYIDLNEDFFWSAQCRGFAIGSFDNNWKWGSILGEYDTV